MGRPDRPHALSEWMNGCRTVLFLKKEKKRDILADVSAGGNSFMQAIKCSVRAFCQQRTPEVLHTAKRWCRSSSPGGSVHQLFLRACKGKNHGPKIWAPLTLGLVLCTRSVHPHIDPRNKAPALRVSRLCSLSSSSRSIFFFSAFAA